VAAGYWTRSLITAMGSRIISDTTYLDIQPAVEIDFFAFNFLQFINKIKDFIVA